MTDDYLVRIIGWHIDDLLEPRALFWRRSRSTGEIRAELNMNDMFYWATSDSETIDPQDLDRLEELLREEHEADDRKWGALKGVDDADERQRIIREARDARLDGAMQFTCEKRQQRPQKPWFTKGYGSDALNPRLLQWPDGDEYYVAHHYMCPTCEKRCVPVTEAFQVTAHEHLLAYGFIDYPTGAELDEIIGESYRQSMPYPFMGVKVKIVVDPQFHGMRHSEEHTPCPGGTPVRAPKKERKGAG